MGWQGLIPPEASSVQSRGLQDALTDGWPSNVSFAIGVGTLTSMILSFLYAWWGAVLALLLMLLIKCVVARTNLVPETVDWYILKLMNHAQQRHANYSRDDDTMRADAAKNLADILKDLLELYLNSGVPAPTMKIAKRAPYGDYTFLFKVMADNKKSRVMK